MFITITNFDRVTASPEAYNSDMDGIITISDGGLSEKLHAAAYGGGDGGAAEQPPSVLRPVLYREIPPIRRLEAVSGLFNER